MSKVEKILLGFLIFFTLVLTVEVFLLYQKGYFKSGFLKTAPPEVPQVETYEIAQPKKGNISLISEVPGYRLVINNQEKLDQFLEEVDFWEDNAVIELRHPDTLISAKTLEIKLVSQVGDTWWWRQETEQEEPVVAVDTEVEKEKEVARILLFLWNEGFKDRERGSKRLDSPFRLGLYGLSPRIREETKQCVNLEETAQKIKEKYSGYSDLFKIETE